MVTPNIGSRVRLTDVGKDTLVNDLDGSPEFAESKGDVIGFNGELVVVTLYSTIDDHASDFEFWPMEIEEVTP